MASEEGPDTFGATAETTAQVTPTPTEGPLAVLSGLIGLRPAGSGDEGEEHLALGLVGDVERPRFLLPLGHRGVTRAALLTYQGLRPMKTRAGRRFLAAVSRVGAVLPAQIDSALPHARHRFVADRGAGSLVAALSDTLGVDDMHVGIGVGNFDEVWKPTLQCFSPDGDPLAYAKVGLGPIGAHLVDAERQALEAWSMSDDPRLVVPALTGTVTWNGLTVILTEPMPLDARRLPPTPIGAWPVRQLDPGPTQSKVGSAPWWLHRRRRHAEEPEIDDILAAIERRHADDTHQWARWHGDWVPWNMARCSRGLVVWDWEYSEPGAPVGLDEAHATYQQHRVVLRSPVDESLAAARHAAADPWIGDAHLAMLVTRSAHLAALHGSPFGDHHEIVRAAKVLGADRSRR